MKAQWAKISARIDGMSLRERIAMFIAAVAVVLFVINALVLEPLFARNKGLAEQIQQQNAQLEAANASVAAQMAAFNENPDAATQKQLAEMNREAASLAGGLRAMQHGLVAPEKMGQLLQQLLRSNGKLKLLSLRTLPVSGMGGGSSDPKAAPAPRELLYRHGVEVVLQGGYLDMLDYMEALEGSPQQVFWGRAQLDARTYPSSTLTLTLYTMGLDEKWMTL
ncbi:type II secretion system protein M [Pseudoduganella violaceinigra]|uniref:type II secretion system protein M n=1 Tax=Pseudoduganella violaceinigra TaxID=246602 RepID=UPI000413CDAD|nr:type II secretion system protein M [Pseudoduganella violaceinigra]